ncbi:phage scaffolding protein [Cohnella thailandensis]|uniref:Phage scaffolding protein n=1 Tax=Cohnella thailandensis TaxID=557557 RepID=A0A841SS82_9BACL|nr:phage scaffolding protein [Cohnella thailandensis]MBB6632770.1 phage scaffolding protein [Cohnella thailandensis]MBP1975541.1 hypothetical protein [Cohnella thailandensis]
MEWLKKLLEAQGLSGDQIKAITEGVETNYKDWIPKHRFDEVNTAKKKAEDELKDRDKQLEDLKKSVGDNEELKKQIETLQGENKTAKQNYENEIKDLRMSTALKLALAADTHDPDLVVGLLDKTKIELDEAGNVKTGLDDQLKGLRTGKPFLFKEQQKPQFKGAKPPSGSDPDFSTSPELTALQDAYTKAVESKNMPLQISIKNQIHALQVSEKG